MRHAEAGLVGLGEIVTGVAAGSRRRPRARCSSRPGRPASCSTVKKPFQSTMPEPGSRKRHQRELSSGLMPVRRSTCQRISQSFRWTSQILLDEVPRALDRVHELPLQVRRIEEQARRRASRRSALKSASYPTGPGGDVRPAGIGLPDDLHVVLLAQREVLLGVDANDLVHLLVQACGRACSRHRAHVGNARAWPPVR